MTVCSSRQYVTVKTNLKLKIKDQRFSEGNRNVRLGKRSRCGCKFLAKSNRTVQGKEDRERKREMGENVSWEHLT